MQFKDYFSSQSNNYAKYRPTYPPALYDFLLSQVAEKKMAWDCATGSGQVANILGDYFEQVIATDASKAQLVSAIPHKNVQYQQAKAEKTNLATNSINLITVGQAIHWFDFIAFFKEVKRVAKDQAILAFWTYDLFKIDPIIDQIIHDFYWNVIFDYWPKERRYIEDKYETIPMPFKAIQTPDFQIVLNYTLQDVIGYLNTWSGTKQYYKQKEENPVEKISPILSEAWGNLSKAKTVVWPMYVKVGRIQK